MATLLTSTFCSLHTPRKELKKHHQFAENTKQHPTSHAICTSNAIKHTSVHLYITAFVNLSSVTARNLTQQNTWQYFSPEPFTCQSDTSFWNMPFYAHPPPPPTQNAVTRNKCFTERCGRVVNIPASYSGGPVFKSRPWDWLSRQRFSVFFLGPSRRMPR
jgi:hypothetical protein